MKDSLRFYCLILAIGISALLQASTILNPIVMDYGDISGQGSSTAEISGCTFPGDCLRMTWELNCVCVPKFPSSPSPTDEMTAFSLNAAVLIPIALPDPTNVVLKDPWWNGPFPGPFPNPGPGPFDPTPPDVIVTWSASPDVALDAAFEAGTPAGMRWVGFKSSQVLPNVKIGNSVDFKLSFIWEGLPFGSELATGKIWFSDNTDDLFGTTVISAITEVKEAVVFPEHSIGTTQTFASFDGSGVSPNPLVNQLNSDYWRFSGFSDGDSQWGDYNVTGDFARGLATGPVFLGGIYGINNGYFRGMLIQPTNSDFTPGSATTRFLNNTSGTIDALEVGFEMLVNNSGSISTRISFLYSTDDSIYIPIPELEVITPDGSDFTSNVHVAGISLDGLNIGPGEYIYLQWESDDSPSPSTFSRDEFALTNIHTAVPDMDCDPTVPPEPTSAIDRSATDNLIILDWENFPGSVGCQVNAERLTPSGPSITVNQIGMKLSNYAVPSNLLTPGATYQYRVRCACSLSPIVASPWSVFRTFNAPVLREDHSIQVEEFAVFPNPASNSVRVEIPVGTSVSVVSLIAPDGRLMLKKNVGNAVNTSRFIDFDISELPEGIYKLLFDTGQSQSLIVAH